MSHPQIPHISIIVSISSASPSWKGSWSACLCNAPECLCTESGTRSSACAVPSGTHPYPLHTHISTHSTHLNTPAMQRKSSKASLRTFEHVLRAGSIWRLLEAQNGSVDAVGLH